MRGGPWDLGLRCGVCSSRYILMSDFAVSWLMGSTETLLTSRLVFFYALKLQLKQRWTSSA